MAHDQELVEHLVKHLQLLDPAFAVEILNAIDAAGFVVMPKEPTAEMVAYAREAHIARVRRKVRDGTVGLDPDGTLVEQYRAMLRGRHPLAYEEADE